MAKKALSPREVVMLLFLAVLLIGTVYYMAFYQPMQQDIANIQSQTAQLQNNIMMYSAQVASMDKMQMELDEILSRDEVTEIAPFDNAKVVMSQLNSILQASDDYNLRFVDPVIEKDGTVRRNVSMDFTCKDYASAKSIIRSLSASRWRCLITNVSIAAVGESNVTMLDPETNEEYHVYDGIMTNPVSVKATLVFFESTNIQ